MIIFNLNSLSYCRGFTKTRCKNFYSSRNTNPDFEHTKCIKDIHAMRSRKNPVIFKLDSKEFHNLFTDEVKNLKNLFDKYEYKIRIAGGAVRDLLLDQPVKSIDFATTATPQQMFDMFTAEKINWVNMFKAKCGTVTPELGKNKTFEITSLRVDKFVEGGAIEFEFIKSWELDAKRRDFTVNTMFLDFDGYVYDYLFGYEDLQKRKIVFVGDPDIRIKEDYLRILRYFRFYGKIAEKPDDHDDNTLKIIKDNAKGLLQLKDREIMPELKKILQGKFAGNILKTMIDLNIGKYIGIPNPNTDELSKLLHRSGNLILHPMTYLAALMHHIGDVAILNERMNFSNYEVDMLYFIVENRGNEASKHFKTLVMKEKRKNRQDIKDYVHELLKYKDDRTTLDEFNKWEIPKFPINVKILKSKGVPHHLIKSMLINMYNIWAENGFHQSTEDLSKLIPNLLEDNKEM